MLNSTQEKYEEEKNEEYLYDRSANEEMNKAIYRQKCKNRKKETNDLFLLSKNEQLYILCLHL